MKWCWMWNWLSELGLLFWCAYLTLELNVRVTDILNYFYLWSNQNADLPTYLPHIFQNMIMQHYECIFLAPFVSMPSLLGGCQCNTIEWIYLLSLIPAFRNVLNYPIPSLGSKPPSYLILHRCSRRKKVFFSLNKCQGPGKVLYKEMQKSALCWKAGY